MKKINFFSYVTVLALANVFSSCSSEETYLQNETTSTNLELSIEMQNFKTTLIDAGKVWSSKNTSEKTKLSDQPKLISDAKMLLIASGYTEDELQNLSNSQIISRTLRIYAEKTKTNGHR